MDSVYMNTLRFRDTYARLFAAAPHNSHFMLRQCSTAAASTLRILESLARFIKRKHGSIFDIRYIKLFPTIVKITPGFPSSFRYRGGASGPRSEGP